eukprot:m.90285 g.90285  ORF g.90285 m.90285 type:complete len:661 (-) comp12914_c1_seq1:1775-3757(-)
MSSVAPEEDAEATARLERIVFSFLKKKNFKEAAKALAQQSKVLNFKDDEDDEDGAEEIAITNQLAAIVGEADPDDVEESYSSLNKWIANSLDQYKNELNLVTYPIFVYLFLDLIYCGRSAEARRFMETHHHEHSEFHGNELAKLMAITSAEQAAQNEAAVSFRQNKYCLTLCTYSTLLLMSFLQDHKYTRILRIINQHMSLKVLAGNPSQRLDVGGLGIQEGNLGGINKQEVSWGTVSFVDDDEDDEDAAGPADDETKRKRPKRRPDAPTAPQHRVPIPEIKGKLLEMKQEELRELKRRVELSSSKLPSCCAYTMFNYKNVTAMAFSSDAKLLATGAADSSVRVWSLTDRKLVELLPQHKLAEKAERAKESGQGQLSLEEAMDASTAESVKVMRGHSGPVYSVAFSPDNVLLISGSEDKTVRLWSLVTFQNLVCYRGHNFPVWHVEFSPVGYYFASASHDRTARLWSTPQTNSQRIFAGHLSDVDCVKFHPNANYIATGSTDKSCRLWDVLEGTCVRVFQGHRDTIHALEFSHDGRFLASAADDWDIILWDLKTSRKIRTLHGHQDVVYCLAFSQEDAILASGGADNSVRIWDCQCLADERQATTAQLQQDDVDDLEPGDESPELLTTYRTKDTPVLTVKFGYTNYLLAAGVFVKDPTTH